MMKKFSFLAFLMLFTSLSFSQQYTTGLDFNKQKYEEVTETVPLITRSITSVPKSASLKAFAPTPGNQGRQPSCVGWASGYGARTIANAVRNGWKYNRTKINQNTFSPAFVYNLIKFKGDVNCQRGSYIADAMKLMNTYGILKLTDFSYNQTNCRTKPSSFGYQKAKKNKILTYERLAKWDNPYNLVGKVKKALANKNPVVIGMQIYTTFYKAKGVWSGPLGSKRLGGHAMVVVGYDDNKYGGAFEILNSWGTAWGNGGYIWVRYNDFKNYTKTAYVLVDKSSSPIIKNDNNDNNNNYNTLAGELTLRLSNGQNMRPILSNEANRNFSIVKASKTTYRIADSYTSGTQFRIYLKSKQRGYVYLIGYGSADKSVNKLYPFENFSDYFSYTDSEIALPNEDYFIEFDSKPGRDVLCVLYSKEKLNIDKIVSAARYGSGDFVSRVKKALQYKMYKGSDVKFSRDKIAFSTKATNNNGKVVPIFIEMNHQ